MLLGALSARTTTYLSWIADRYKLWLPWSLHYDYPSNQTDSKSAFYTDTHKIQYNIFIQDLHKK